MFPKKTKLNKLYLLIHKQIQKYVSHKLHSGLYYISNDIMNKFVGNN